MTERERLIVSDNKRDEILVRELSAKWEDYESYNKLISQLSSQYKEYDYDTYKYLLGKLGGNERIYVCELSNSLIVGTIKILMERKLYSSNSIVGHIEDVVIDDKYRGLGLGKKLVDHAVKLCEKWGCYKVKLYCDEKNVGFYEKNGFMVGCIDMVMKL